MNPDSVKFALNGLDDRARQIEWHVRQELIAVLMLRSEIDDVWRVLVENEARESSVSDV